MLTMRLWSMSVEATYPAKIAVVALYSTGMLRISQSSTTKCESSLLLQACAFR